MYIKKMKMLSLMCWLATSMPKYSSMIKIEIIVEPAIICICILLSDSSVRHCDHGQARSTMLL